MISPEDMTMVADLMLQMHSEDDREFFDCGDDNYDNDSDYATSNHRRRLKKNQKQTKVTNRNNR